jgi:hypothetical protein
MDGKDISNELWRSYSFVDQLGYQHEYAVILPKTLYVGTTTHRVVDREGVAHVLPAPGYFGCVLKFEQADGGVTF